MRCQFHPDYDPTSGKPTDPLSAMVNYGSVKDIPCPYCWQMREHYQAYRAHNYHNAIITLEERIRELKVKLEKAKEKARIAGWSRG